MTKVPPPHAASDAERAMYGVDDLSQDRIRAQWPTIGDRMRRRWHKLTADDVQFHDGGAEYLAGVLCDRYGIGRREALLQVFEFESEL